MARIAGVDIPREKRVIISLTYIHGIGRAMHEEPQVPNYGRPGTGMQIEAGMCFAIEPMFTLGNDEVFVADDNWTVRTTDGSLAAHFENTIAVSDEGPQLLTAELA